MFFLKDLRCHQRHIQRILVTLVLSLVSFSSIADLPPKDAEVREILMVKTMYRYMNFSRLLYSSTGFFSYTVILDTVKMCVDNNKVYLNSMGNLDTGWITGKIQGDSVIFRNASKLVKENRTQKYLTPSDMDLIENSGNSYLYYHMKATPNLQDLRFKYDSNSNVLSEASTSWIITDKPNQPLNGWADQNRKPHLRYYSDYYGDFRYADSPEEFFNEYVYCLFMKDFTAGPIAKDNFKPMAPTSSTTYDNSTLQINSYKCYFNTDGQMLNVMNLYNVLTIYDADSPEITNDDPEPPLLEKIYPYVSTERWSYTLGEEYCIELNMVDPSYADGIFDHLHKAYHDRFNVKNFPENFTLKRYTRYYPEGKDVNPDYYIDSDPEILNFSKSSLGVTQIYQDKDKNTGSNEMYDLAGRQIDPTNVKPGIYIRNGKKILIK